MNIHDVFEKTERGEFLNAEDIDAIVEAVEPRKEIIKLILNNDSLSIKRLRQEYATLYGIEHRVKIREYTQAA